MKNFATNLADKNLGHEKTITPTQPIVDESVKMKALIWNGKKDVEYVEKPRPCITDQRDILLRVTATAICGSDLHLYQGTMLGMQSGDILGHEFMGIIEEAGSEVKKFKPGQRVVVSFNIACGSCDYCQRQEFTACDTTNPSRVVEKMYGHRTAALFGYSHLTGGVPGGQSEFVRVPFADVNCLAIPDEIPDEKALFLSDIIPTSFHGTQLGKVKAGSTVAIWGLGPVGLLTARWCQILGASKIVGIDRVPDRLDKAKNFLGIHTINFKEQNVLEVIGELIPGGPDVAIECVGFDYPKTFIHKVEMALSLETDTSDILNEMFTAVRKFGRVAVIGVYSGFTNHFNVGAMMEKDLIIKCGQCPVQKYWEFALEKVKSGEMDPTFIVSACGKLSEGPELYKNFMIRKWLRYL